MSSSLSPFSDLLRRRFPSHNLELSSPAWTTPNDSTPVFGRRTRNDNQINEIEFQKRGDSEESGSSGKTLYQAGGGFVSVKAEEVQRPVHQGQQSNHARGTSAAAITLPHNPWRAPAATLFHQNLSRPSLPQTSAVPSSPRPSTASGWAPTMAGPSRTTFFGQSMPSPDFARTPAAFQANREPYLDTAAPTVTDAAIDNSNFYHPMHCRVRSVASTEQEAHGLLLRGFSPNYRGNPSLARNQSAAIPAEENCSLFLVGLSPDLTTHELLSGIRNTGRVYATHINPPDLARGHMYSAAKLVFFEREAAERFYTTHATHGFATPRHPNLRARVSWNRVRSGEVDTGGSRSRVLLVSGPRAMADEAFLRAFFDTKLTYQIDAVLHRGFSPDGERALLEFRFGSYRCQAEAARMALMREFGGMGVVCVYGHDPCCDPEPEVERGVGPGLHVPLIRGA